MLIIDEASDNHIFAGWSYFAAWRASRNGLLLLDALESVQRAEVEWRRRAPSRPMRREWHVLRRCITRGLIRLSAPLNAARTPSETQRALYGGGKRAQLARIDQLNRQAIVVALGGLRGGTVDFDEAMQTLSRWGITRSRGYLKKFASENGLTRRHVTTAAHVVSPDTWNTLFFALRPTSYPASQS